MMSNEQVKQAFRKSGSKKCSGYSVKRFLAKLTERLPTEHKGHKVMGMLFADWNKGVAIYACSCGSKLTVQSKVGPKEDAATEMKG